MGKYGKTKLPPSKTMNRKEKRKAERQLKKQRRAAYTQKDFTLVSDLKNVDTAFKAKRKKEREERLKLKKKNKKKGKKEEKKEVEDSRVQGLKLAIQQDEKELKQLEKHLKFRKKKGTTKLPSSFVNDGLDYILDATDSEKIATFDDAIRGIDDLGGDESDSSDTDTDVEQQDSETEERSTWDPEAKAAKSILKDKKPKKTVKNVKFNVAESDTESDPFEDQFSGIEDLSSDEDDDVETGLQDFDGEENLPEDEESDVEITKESGEIDQKMDEDDMNYLQKKGMKRKSEDDDLKEDIYGRLRDKEGNVVQAGAVGSYIPPAKRAMMAGNQGNEQLRKKLKGLLNKVSEGAMQVISSQVEALYLENSRADVNETMTTLILESLMTPTLSPERIVAETVMLIAILHSNVGTEIGAFFIQTVVQKFDQLLMESSYGSGKLMENVLLIIANVYNFKIIHSKLIFDIMQTFINQFEERDIELLLHLLKSVGFSLRKDDPARLKQTILDIQTKARAAESSAETSLQSRIRFMLDVLVAVRNNNMRKIPSYDPTHIEHLRKIIRTFLRGEGLGGDELNIGLAELLRADQVGRWWIVGSAWQGQGQEEAVKEAKSKTETNVVGTMSKQMLRLAKQQGMNTDIRRHIFCILGTSEDFEDAFGRLLRLGLNKSQEREIIHVLLHCSLNEKLYNPFYSFLAQKFCSYDRRFAMTVQFSMWDKFKEIDEIPKSSREKLAHFLSHLLLGKGLSLSVFKVVEFGMESKKMIRFLCQVLRDILESPNETTVMEVFERIAPFSKLKTLRQGLQVFMRVHLKVKTTDKSTSVTLQERIEKADSAMFSHQASQSLL